MEEIWVFGFAHGSMGLIFFFFLNPRIENMRQEENSKYIINFLLSILVERISGTKNPKGLDNPHI